GVDGLIVPARDAAALARAIEPLMRDPAAAAAMGARGRARAIEHFSLDAEATAIAEVYRAVS
ncbi:MAG: glycosyltransferase family 1 protein, partial [Xanthobacteraceae bacterium]|nr:glycosyltransferase family 1 protein [Xanthobacteraceae bacterium]